MKYKPYPAYKDSGVEWLGKVPEKWGVTRIGRMFEIQKRIAGELGHDVLSITQRGIQVKDTESNDGQLSMDYTKYQRVEVGEFAMNHMDLITGFIDIAQFPGVTSPDYRVFRLRDASEADSRFYLAVFQDAYRRKLFFPFGQGSSQLGRWRLPTDAFKEYPIPVPPKEQQSAIATFLDRETAKLDTLIAKQEKLIELLQEKRQALISHAVTKGLNPDAPMKDPGVAWLGEVPEHWVITAIKHVCSLLKDGTHLPPARVDDGIPLLSVRNLQNGQFGLLDDDSKISENDYDVLCRPFTPASGDVLLAIVGATLGKTAVIPEGLGRFHIQRSLGLFRTNRQILNLYLWRVFESGQFQRLLWENVGFSAQPGIYLGSLANFKFPLPPLEEQTFIVGHLDCEVSKLDTLIEKSRRSIDLMREHRTALISAAVTGKIDVREAA